MKRRMGHGMVEDTPMPFKVGQLVEIRSFMKGYKGAWFRCEIKDISQKGNRCVRLLLRYIDYPDEQDEWTELYKTPPSGWSTKREKQLMLRPKYPPIYHSIEPSINAISEVIVISDGDWHVGDLVDWFEKDCYWTGKVTHILGDEEAMVELLPPPWGEGDSYRASFSNLRPSLDWSPKDGWTVPVFKDGGNFPQCARLVYPMNRTVGDSLVSTVPVESECLIDNPVSAGLPSNLAADSHVEVGYPGVGDMKIESQNCTKEVIGTPGSGDESLQNIKASVEVPLNSTQESTLEAALMDFEELANKLTWLGKILKFGMPLSDVGTASWKFVEHHGSYVPK
ncbi:OLC1v1019807C1 [Oldenlandia corymbosa var. corymbosa]|uniref:OLC1v1019807C1 n=1 Tax=Oldenlandia corymbosa var. corymbosa TaxID=529605 RepID=A0AAV1EET7_OLDCO|nr:OLC1v1019807C1 [Oldenlandia corymbosa var. corymbosa]